MKHLIPVLLLSIAATLGAEEDPIPASLVARLDANGDGAVQLRELFGARKVWDKLGKEDKAWILRCHARIKRARKDGTFTVDREWRNSAGGHGSSHSDVSISKNNEGGVDVHRSTTGSHTNRRGETTEGWRESDTTVTRTGPGGRAWEGTVQAGDSKGRGFTAVHSGSSQRDGQGGVTWEREVDKTLKNGTTVHKDIEGSSQKTADGRTWERTCEGSTSTGKSWTTDGGGTVKKNADGSAYYQRTRTTTGADGKTHTTTERGVIEKTATGTRSHGHRTDTRSNGDKSHTRSTQTSGSTKRSGGTTTRTRSATGKRGRTRSRGSRTTRRRK